MLEFFQQFLLSFWNMSLWVAVNAIILFIANELLQLLPGKKFSVDKGRLSRAALVLGLIFLVMVSWHVYQTLMTPQP
jgi:hypothetical protein